MQIEIDGKTFDSFKIESKIDWLLYRIEGTAAMLKKMFSESPSQKDDVLELTCKETLGLAETLDSILKDSQQILTIREKIIEAKNAEKENVN